MRQLFAWAGVFLAAPAGWAQFASERPAFGGASPVAAPPGTTRTQPVSTAAPAQRINPVPSTIDPANEQTHPWAVKLDHGQWMICVRAYAGPNSRALAEKLVQEIRKSYDTAAYVFERNSAERKAELAQIQAIRDKENLRAQPFLQQIEQEKKKAAASGSLFVDDRKHTIKIPTPYHQTPEQWAVLIGGFKTDTEARKALTIVKTFKDPADVSLMDRALVGAQTGAQTGAKQGEEQWKSEWNYINPYRGAIVVPNPMQTSANRDEKGKLDPFVVKMNEEGTFNLLRNRKPWTLIVRSYSVPMRFANKEEASESLFDKVLKAGTKQRSLFDVTAQEAESLAAALSHPEMKGGPFKAFVLHHRTGSIVTVGEFDAVDAPELLRVQQQLSGLKFDLLDKSQKPVIGKDGLAEKQRMFDSVSPFPVPKG